MIFLISEPANMLKARR